MTGWRIVPGQHERSAFSGEGARLYGGRWNFRGVPIVYTSQHLSLAAVELLVHRNTLSWRGDFVAFRAEWEDSLVEHLDPSRLPGSWRAEPPPLALQQIGDAWARGNRSAVLAVPSVVIPQEFNYLLNPLHPAFKKIFVRQPETFVLDPRLVGLPAFKS